MQEEKKSEEKGRTREYSSLLWCYCQQLCRQVTQLQQKKLLTVSVLKMETGSSKEKLVRCYYDTLRYLRCYYDTLRYLRCYYDTLRYLRCYYDTLRYLRCYYDTLRYLRCYYDTLRYLPEECTVVGLRNSNLSHRTRCNRLLQVCALLFLMIGQLASS
jgi:hypothetical protein